jgi:hypothetical protein
MLDTGTRAALAHLKPLFVLLQQACTGLRFVFEGLLQLAAASPQGGKLVLELRVGRELRVDSRLQLLLVCCKLAFVLCHSLLHLQG